MSTTVRTVLYKYQSLKSGEFPIYLRLVKGRFKKEFPLAGRSSKAEWWDEVTGLPNRKHPHHKEMTIFLNTVKTQAQRLILGLENDGEEYSLEEVVRLLRSEKQHRKITVLDFILEEVREENSAGRIGTGNVFKATHNSLKTFRTNRDFEFSDVTHGFLVRYEEWLGSRSVKPNTKFLYLRTFKTLLNRAKSADLVKKGFDPFKNLDFTKYRKVKTRKRALSTVEMERLKALSFEPGTRLHLAHSLFLFSYHCWGMNFVDMAHLKWSDVRGDNLLYTRKKTKGDYDVSLNSGAKRVLEHFRSGDVPDEDDYIFPILDLKRHLTPKQVDYRIDKKIKEVNEGLKEIGSLAGIATELTTYVARHSFATALKRKGISTAHIQEMLGHDSERTTQIYLDSFGNDVLRKIAEECL